MKRISGLYILRYLGLLFLVLFYSLGGINHFRDPGFYLPLIPSYFPFPEAINITAGIAEIGLGIGLGFPSIRKVSAILIVLMLIAFIPSHVYLIQLGGCVDGGLCVPSWIAWVRLIVIHPLLIIWVWSYRNSPIQLTRFYPGA
jgi:uncharacterized membrane protein